MNACSSALALAGGLSAGWVPWKAAAAYLGGNVLWTAVEYAMHRWLFHGVLARGHARHHVAPRDTRYLHGPVQLWVPTVLVAGGAFMATLGVSTGLFCLAGLNTSYLLFELTHAGVHGPYQWRWFRPARRFHAAHHFHASELGFGFSTPFWDWACGTLDPAARVQRWLLRLIPLPIPMLHFALSAMFARRTDDGNESDAGESTSRRPAGAA